MARSTPQFNIMGARRRSMAIPRGHGHSHRRAGGKPHVAAASDLQELANNTVSGSAPTQVGSYEVFASFDGTPTITRSLHLIRPVSVVIRPVGQLPVRI